MNRSQIVRLELLLLAGVTLLLAYRVIEGPPPPDGLIVHARIEPEQILRRSMAADGPGRITIDAAGSFEPRSSELAAYGWILRRADRDVVWKMDPSSVRREKETLALVRDTIDLDPGAYDVYYASYGNRVGRRFGISFLDRLLGEKEAWQGDADAWKLVVRSANSAMGRLDRLESEADEALSPGGEGLLWSTAPMKGRATAEYVFHATEPVELEIYAVGEIDRRPTDYGWIDDAVSGERVWEMMRENTEPAGGWEVNRLYDGAIRLPGGMYRAVFETDARHHFGDWEANPPFDPAGWGITLSVEDGEAVRSFDPWSSRTPIIQIDRVGDDERRSVQFMVHEPVQIAVYALGELGESGRFDYGWIRDNDTQSMVWEMTAERSRPAGGHSNRRELSFLTLEPSTYTLTYETDDSHAYDAWRHERPHHPERWGVTLFPVDEQIDSSVVEIVGRSREDLGEAPRADVEPPPPGSDRGAAPLPGETLVDLTRLGNEQRVSKTFTLESPERLQVRALGEISLSAPYDYGWIEKAESGEIVWQMDWQNTVPAGGNDSYRRFDGTLQLEPGEYVAHFKTDFSRAYGDFGEQAPRDPEAWGLQIVRSEPQAP